MTKIIQWNMNGYRGNFEYLIQLIHDYNPAVLALQELKLHGKELRPPK